MSLTKEITEQLEIASPDQAVDIRVADEDLRVELDLADWGRLGCLLDRLEIRHTHEGGPAIDPVQITERITYLEEKLRIVEREGERGRTILRSSPPRVDGEVISFFEIVLDRATGLSLRRYRYDHRTEERTPAAAPLSRATLERLVGDLITLAQGARP
jgi:hypothetical protein